MPFETYREENAARGEKATWVKIIFIYFIE